MPWNKISIARNIPKTQNGESGDDKIRIPVNRVNIPEKSIHPQPEIGLRINAFTLRIIPAIIKATAKKLVNTTAVITGVVKAK